MLLDTLVRGRMRNKNEDEVKDLIEYMCQNEYYRQRDRAPMKKGMLELDTKFTLL